MSSRIESSEGEVNVSAIIRDGAYYVVDDFALRAEMYPKVVAAFLEGVEALQSPESRRTLERLGLRKLHEVFPVAKVRLLEDFVLKRLRESLYYWSYAVGHQTLRLPHPFYVDYLIVVRIHYPFLSAKAERGVVEPPFPFREKLRLLGASAKNVHMLWNRLGVGLRKGHARRQKRIAYDPASYHGELPTPARAHGPHMDTWYGHSYDGINLWWSIDGVDPDNTVILYPDMFGRPLRYDPKSMYLASGVPVTRPHKIDMRPGQLLIFNPETLHGTQVNISDKTRVALTTRLNPWRPRFNDDAPFNFEYWYASGDLERGRFRSLKVFPSHVFRGEASVKVREPFEDARTTRMRIAEHLKDRTPIKVCAGSDIKRGHKMAVDFEDAKLVLWRSEAGVKAFRRICPHLGVDLADGYHDGERVFCPGHGVAFSWKDGTSACSAFRLRSLTVFERDGDVYVQDPAGSSNVRDTG